MNIVNQLLSPSTCASKIVYLTTLGCQPMATLATHRFPLPMPVGRATPWIITCSLGFIRISHDLRIDHIVHLIYKVIGHSQTAWYKYHCMILPLYTPFFWGRLSPKTLKSRAQLETIVAYVMASLLPHGIDESRKPMDLWCISFILMSYNFANNKALPRTWRF